MIVAIEVVLHDVCDACGHTKAGQDPPYETAMLIRAVEQTREAHIVCRAHNAFDLCALQRWLKK